MSIPSRSKYVAQARPGARAGITVYCARDDLPSLWLRMVIAEKDLENLKLEWVVPGVSNPDLAVINPAQTLPTLSDRDAVIYPAAIAAEYLDERFPHPRLTPSDPAMRARMRMLLARFESELWPLAAAVRSATRAADATAARKQLTSTLTWAAGMFGSRGWSLGSEFTLLDCAWATLLSQADALKIKLPDHPQMQDYLRRLFGRPALAGCLARSP